VEFYCLRYQRKVINEYYTLWIRTSTAQIVTLCHKESESESNEGSIFPILWKKFYCVFQKLKIIRRIRIHNTVHQFDAG
jgi:hypothetical protein